MAYAIMVPLLIAAHTALARAEIHIKGSASNVNVDARDATVADVLAALAAHFGLRVLGTVGDRRISANFDGSLRQVIKRVLDGYGDPRHTYARRRNRGDGTGYSIVTRGAAAHIRGAYVSGCQATSR